MGIGGIIDARYAIGKRREISRQDAKLAKGRGKNIATQPPLLHSYGGQADGSRWGGGERKACCVFLR